jgi:peptidoglycan/LPS O-acetylase OafA/YrhL
LEGVPQRRPVDPVAGYRPRYRADIDGLRAIAVLAVMLYHFRESALPAGFLGVDVFFVISGFLITLILIRESEAGDYSIARFYERRIRRIMPALLAVLIATTAAVWLIYLSADARAHAASVLATLAFASNLYFWRDSANYFFEAATTRPLLHTWTLGIEEQFYILFPILLLVLMKLGGRRAAWWGVAGIAIVSFALAVAAEALGKGIVLVHWWPARHADLSAFYLLPMRAWELGLGAGLAILRDSSSPGGRLRTPLAVAAVLLLAASLGLLEPSAHAPLPPATFACLATAALIWAGQDDNPIASLLGARPLVAVGLISYSLYLWHWPIYVLGRYYLIREPTAVEASVMVALTAVLATLSWRYIERPFRGRRIPTRRVLAIVATLVLAVGAAAFAIRASDGAPGRLSPAVASYDRLIGRHYDCRPARAFIFDRFAACLLAAPGRDIASAEVVLFGNSHAQMYTAAVENVLARRGRRGVLLTKGGCFPVSDFNVNRECVAAMRDGIEAVARLPARTVIIGTTWPDAQQEFVDAAGREIGPVSSARYLAAMQRTLDRLEGAGKRVVLVGPVPWPGYNVASVAARELAYKGRLETPLAQPRAAYDARFGAIEAWLDDVASRTTVVRPSRLLCDLRTCSYELHGKLALYDQSHLSVSIMPEFEPLFAAALDEAQRPLPEAMR